MPRTSGLVVALGTMKGFWKLAFKKKCCLFNPLFKTILCRDFPGGPVVKTSPSNAGGAGSIPGHGAKIPHASQPRK